MGIADLAKKVNVNVTEGEIAPGENQKQLENQTKPPVSGKQTGTVSGSTGSGSPGGGCSPPERAMLQAEEQGAAAAPRPAVPEEQPSLRRAGAAVLRAEQARSRAAEQGAAAAPQQGIREEQPSPRRAGAAVLRAEQVRSRAAEQGAAAAPQQGIREGQPSLRRAGAAVLRAEQARSRAGITRRHRVRRFWCFRSAAPREFPAAPGI